MRFVPSKGVRISGFSSVKPGLAADTAGIPWFSFLKLSQWYEDVEKEMVYFLEKEDLVQLVDTFSKGGDPPSAEFKDLAKESAVLSKLQLCG